MMWIGIAMIIGLPILNGMFTTASEIGWKATLQLWAVVIGMGLWFWLAIHLMTIA